MKIGFFDSGVGGLTVLHDAIIRYPNAHYLYYADTENIPYGTKSKKQIRKLTSIAVNFLVKEDVDLIVIACNTATSAAIKSLRKKYTLPIIGMEPAVKPATELNSKQKKILICATKRTLKEKKLKRLIHNLKASDRIELLSLQKLVMLAEKFNFTNKKSKEYLKKTLQKINWSEYNSIVLGCTHFLYFKNQIRKLIPERIKLIDGNKGTVSQMIKLAGSAKSSKLKIDFYRSGKKVEAKNYLEFLLYLRQNSTD